MSNSKILDQFYTPKDTVESCVQKIIDEGLLNAGSSIIEPSAGEGAFTNVLSSMGFHVKSYDIDPKFKGCVKKDFFSVDGYSKKNIVIGNPPYGRKGKLAVQFINHALMIADVVCFVVPLTLSSSWRCQKNVDSDAILVYDEVLPSPRFIHNGKSRRIPSSFQIWIKKRNFRIEKPITDHKDLEIRIFNKTEKSKKWITDFDWTIALNRNSRSPECFGRVDADKVNFDRHWVLIKGPFHTLCKIDWSDINDNKMTAGIGKADVVKKYTGFLDSISEKS